MDKLTLTFCLPHDIRAGLAVGDLERKGGVIRNKMTGEIVCWLREASSGPLSSGFLGKNDAAGILGFLSEGASSSLSLGATVGFGVAALIKLDRIDKKLDIINHKLDVIDAKIDELNRRAKQIQWTVEVGFAQSLNCLDKIKNQGDVQLLGDLSSAASLAWSCQFIEPNSPQRIARIENAYATVVSAKEKIILHAEHEMVLAIHWMEARSGNAPSRLIVENIIFDGLSRMRQAIHAIALSASISAESGDLYSASTQLDRDRVHLLDLLNKFGRAFMGPDHDMYKLLLSRELMSTMPASRLDIWGRRFGIGGIADIIDLVRVSMHHQSSPSIVDWISSNGASAALAVSNPLLAAGMILVKSESDKKSKDGSFDENKKKGVRNMIDCVDELFSDVDKLHGYVFEYDYASRNAMSIQDYREALVVNDVQDEKGIVYLTLN